MATPPSDSRQPPDGDEFPDFIDNDNELLKYSNRIGYRTLEKETELNTMQDLTKSNSKSFNVYLNNLEDVNNVNIENIPEPVSAHTRSQSLINISSNKTNQKIEPKSSSRLDELVEQRRKSYSKLKGLVIPETMDNDTTLSADPAINIPEIKNLDAAALFTLPKANIASPPVFPVTGPKNTTPITSWTSNTTNSLPKYSPAFKRKSLHVYTTSINKSDQVQDVSSLETNKYCDKPVPRPNKLADDDLNPPKSLESINSPTRSDCSFDYATLPKKNNESSLKVPFSKIEDESDNDSAVSSSQSSFNSRFSPPLSPTKSYPPNSFKRKEEIEGNGSGRLLNASSTEAINRRNILASAKCSSGNNLLNVEAPIESPPPPPKRIEPSPPVTSLVVSNEKVKSVRSYSDVKSESYSWENRNSPPVKPALPERSIKREFARSTESLPELDTSLKVTPRSSITRNYLSKDLTPTKLSDSITKDFLKSPHSSFLSSRKPQPISVKALTQNFEKFGSSPPSLPQKPMVTKPLIPTRNVRNEILKAENKISVSTENIAKADVVEIRPRPRPSKITPVDVRKSEENLASAKYSEKFSTETVVLQLNSPENVLGVSITGGADDKSDIMIHRIRYGSVAYQDGRLNKGDKILSINGKSTKEMTNAEAAELLKEQLPEFIIKRQATESFAPPPGSLQRRSSSLLSIDSKSLTSSTSNEVSTPKTPTHVVSFSKDGSGLGFSIEGGRDSPQGDVPLVVKKIFTGGAADKNGELITGDEIILINEKNFTNLTRIEAWNLMKKIPDGIVKIQIYRKS